MNQVNAGSTPQPPLRSGSPQHGVTPYHAKYFAYGDRCVDLGQRDPAAKKNVWC
jgi:hypothetical protein